MQPSPDAVTSVSRFCTSCGAAVDQVRFCGSCGAAVVQAVVPAQPLSSPPLPAHHTADVPSQPVGDDAAGPHHGRDHVTAVLPQSALAPVWQQEAGDEFPVSWQDGHDGALDAAEPVDTSADVGARAPRRRAVLVTGAAVAVAAVVAGSLLGVRYVQDGDLRDALATSTRAYDRVVLATADATDAAGVARSAKEAAPAVDTLDRALRRLGRGTAAEEIAVRKQLESEKAVLLAVGGLVPVDEKPLRTWARAHGPLAKAVDAEVRSRTALRRHRTDDAAAISSAEEMLVRLTSNVAPALVRDATREALRSTTALAAAKTTTELRTLGTTSAGEQAGVQQAAAALPSGEGKQVLTGYASALDALAGLAKVDGENPGPWKTVRAELAAAVGTMKAASADGVDKGLEDAMDSADEVVTSAAAAIADWRAKTDAAVKAREADTTALQDYASFFRSQTKTYEQLRQDLGSFTTRVEESGSTYFEAYQFLSQAASERRGIRDLLVGTSVPDGVESAHTDVVAAVDRAITAVQSAYDGMEQAQSCYDEACQYYDQTPGWQTFLSESDAISKAYSSALTRWEAAVKATRSTITNRPLPVKPVA